MKNEELHSERIGKQLFTASRRLRTAIALPAVLALLGMLTLLPACQDDDRLYTTIPGSNPTPGRLAVASVNLDGHSANTRGGAQAAGDNAQAGGTGAQTRISGGDGNTYQTTDGTALVPANISITGITNAGDRMYLRYNFGGHGFGGYDFSKDAANAAAGTTADRTPNARYCTYTTLQNGGDWLTYAGDASTNPLCPNTSGDGSTGAENGESWAKAQAMLWLAATPQVTEGTANGGSAGSAPSGGLTTTNSTLATDPCGMNYRVGTSTTDIPGITDGQYHVRLYADALVAVSSKAAPDATGGTPDPVEDAGATLSPADLTAGQLAIYRNLNGKNLGGICANLAHTGALMQLSETDIKISGEIFGGGEMLTKGTLSALWVEVALDGEEETFFVPFSRVSAAGVPAGKGVWQAIVPGSIAEEAAARTATATARVLRFVAQMTMTNETGTATANGTFVLKQTNGDAESGTGSGSSTGTTGKALYANLRYPLSLTIALDQHTQQSTITFTLPDGKPQWGEEGTLVDLVQQLDVTYDSSTGAYTYTAKSAHGLKAVADWMADGGTPPLKPADNLNAPDYAGNAPETNADDIAARMKTNLILPMDIDLGGLTVNTYNDSGTNGAANWRPIGTPSAPYTGTFDGGGFTVTGLDIQRPQADYQGFFGTIAAKDGADATVKNLTVTGSVEGKDCVAAIVASNIGGSLENCVGSATVKANGTSARAGGVAGLNDSGTLIACYATGEVSGTGSGSRVGGVVGLNQNNGNLYLCAGMATTLTGDAGGAVGGVTGTNSGGTLTACFTTTTDCKVDGGDGTGGGTQKDCYPIDNKAFGNEGSGVGMESASTEAGTSTPVPSSLQNLNDKYLPARNVAIVAWNNGNPGNKCPYYYKPGSPAQSALPVLTVGEPQMADLLTADGTGPNGQPRYLIGTYDELQIFADLVNMEGNDNYRRLNATLTANITLPAPTEEGGSNWTPMGNNREYAGTFDGAGYTVSGLAINHPDDNEQGFFRNIDRESTVKNLTVAGSVKGRDSTGGIAGNNNGTLNACTNQVEVNGTYSTGGIAGHNSGTLVACTNQATVKGDNSTGGIAGHNSGTLNACINQAAVTGTGSNTGGIAGYNDYGTLNACYPTNNKVFGAQGGSADDMSVSSFEDLNKNYLTQMNFAIMAYNGKASFPYHYEASASPTTSLPTLADGAPELKGFFTLASDLGENGSPVCLLGTADKLSLFATLVNMGGIYLKLNATMTANITLPTPTEEGGSNWTPIGTNQSPYAGTFDGAGYTVEGLAINHPDDNEQGFFGSIDRDGTVKNLTVAGSVKGHNSTGGIVGYNNYGTLTTCISQVAVTGTFSTGGIVGDNNYGTLTTCISTGTVTGTGDNTGGIAGSSNYSLFNTCYPTNNKVFGAQGGSADHMSVSSLEDLNTNYLMQMNFAIMAYGEASGAEYSYFYVAGNPTSSLPTLERKVSGLKGFFTLAEEAGANGSPVCLLSTANELSLFATFVNAGGDYYKLNATLTANIALPTPTEEGGSNWTPMGNLEDNKRYAGTFDGAGYTVSGLAINRPDDDGQGFFRNIGRDGTVKNLTVAGSVKGRINTGGIAGSNEGTVTNCNNQVEVTGTDGSTGGIVGSNGVQGTLVACTNTGTVNGTDNTGGIAGSNEGTVTNCNNQVEVTGTDGSTGGIVGSNGVQGTLVACTNTGTVNGTDNTGGIAGYSYGTVTNCTNQVEVNGTNSSTGGIVGSNSGQGTLVACTNTGTVNGTSSTGGIAGSNHSTLTACYSTGAVTGTGNSTGGIVGYSYGTLTACYSTGTVTGTGGIVGDNYATLNACFYQWGTGVPTVGVGYGAGSNQAANADGSIYFCPVGSPSTTGYENITWPGVMGTAGNATEKVKNGSGTATQIPTLNTAITQWNTKNPTKQCPYRFVENMKQSAVTEGVGSEPLVLEKIE